MKVVDNFLPKDEFDILRDLLESSSFPWYWNNHSVAKDGITQFFHAFMNREGINSDYFNLLTNTSIFPRLGAKGLVKCKANLNYPTIENQTGVFHTDFNDAQNKNIITSILYINTNDGGTKFEDDTKVESVANRMVTFDCSIKHASVSCTNQDRRILINFNYYNQLNQTYTYISS